MCLRAKILLKIGTVCAASAVNNYDLRRGDVSVIGGAADHPCLHNLDEGLQHSISTVGYCTDLLIWHTNNPAIGISKCHRLPIYSKSMQFLPTELPNNSPGDMETAGIWDLVTKSTQFKFGSVNIISEMFRAQNVEKFSDQREKLTFF